MHSIHSLLMQLKMNLPKELEPVIAKIHHISDLGHSEWFEVVYYDTDNNVWCSFAGSDTFEDGERVVGWLYCDEIENSSAFQSC